jgi:hypothetical protein
MCYGVMVDKYGISVANGIATITEDGQPRLVVPVQRLGELIREGMRQHRRERAAGISEADQLARQYLEMAA